MVRPTDERNVSFREDRRANCFYPDGTRPDGMRPDLRVPYDVRSEAKRSDVGVWVALEGPPA